MQERRLRKRLGGGKGSIRKMEGEITSFRSCFKVNRHSRSCAHLPPMIQENESLKRGATQGHHLKGSVQVSEDNRKNGGQLTSEEQRKGHIGL